MIPRKPQSLTTGTETIPPYEKAPARRIPKGSRSYRVMLACEDCHMAPDAPMLLDEVWNSVSHKHGLLCCSCTEIRLERPIALGDLMPCLGNQFTIYWANRYANVSLPQHASTDISDAADSRGVEPRGEQASVG